MKILSIDFDAIMFPCIRLYNEYSAGKESDTQIWNMLEDRFGIQDFLNYDANLYLNIANLVAKNVKNGATFIPIKEHDELVTYLKNNDLLSQKLDVVNLDYHHDVMYHRESLQEIIDFDTWNCANWLGYILLKNEENTGVWVRCPGSSPYSEESCGHSFEERYQVKNLKDMEEIQAEQFDLVFLCLSPQWVPYKYHHLYDTIVNMTETFAYVEEDIESNLITFPMAVIVQEEEGEISDD